MSAITQEELQTAVHAALVQWGKPLDNEPAPLAELLLVQNQLAENGEKRQFNVKHAVDHVLLETVEQLAEQDETGANVLQSRFIDGKITRQVAQDLHASIDQVNRWQRAAIETLTQLFYQQEYKLRAELTHQLEASLPPAPYSQFFGFAETKQTIVAQLVQTSAPWIVVLTGIGGIGKTSLADAVVREVLPSLVYKQLCWLRVESQQFSGEPFPPERTYHALLSALAAVLWPDSAVGQVETRLSQTLKATPHLIIIDNLETTAHVDYFARKLLAFTEPTRFLLTSRARPSGETAVYTQPLHELPFTDAAALLRHHAQVTGLSELADADTDTLQAIYQVTGGNPLALKLVVSLTAVLPLPQILTDLNENRVGPIENLYRHIYWETWRTLTPTAQTLLQAMPLVASSGARPEQMQAFSGLDADDFWTAVRELTARSLLEVQGTLQERRYGIHRLTDTFLQTEIIGWPDELDV
ncbi:MAG: hypothetical protein IAF02_13695 [Anaerolineae bacterium]|nr:hypothetical protein [Anaerolineae bacterium]